MNAPAPVINSFTADSTYIPYGSCTYLRWSTSNASSITLNGMGEPASGSLQVCPSDDTTYSLSACNVQSQCVTQYVTVSIQPYDDATYLSSDLASPLGAGDHYTVHVTMRNTGTTTWTYPGYVLQSVNSPTNLWGPTQAPLPSEQLIYPGGSWTFAIPITAPSTPGNYYFRWQMADYGSLFGYPASLSDATILEPTSMSFNPNYQNAGNGSYTLTVGSGANMNIDFQYTWSGDPNTLLTATDWPNSVHSQYQNEGYNLPTSLDASGQITVPVLHNDPQGTYTYSAVRNTAGGSSSPWNSLPDVTFEVAAPQPQPNSLAFTPSTYQPRPPGTVTVTAGNAAGITVDLRYNWDNQNDLIRLGWPTFGSLNNGPDGTFTFTPAVCNIAGNYLYTGIRNTLLTTWQAVNTPVTVECPGAPTISNVTPQTLTSNPNGPVDIPIAIYGTYLCGVTQITSGAGISFSTIDTDENGDGASMTATATLSPNVVPGTYSITLSTPHCGPASANAITVEASGDAASFQSQSVPSVMNPGQTYPVSVTFQNVGSTPWTSAGGYQLGSQNPRDNTTWGLSRVAMSPNDSIAPLQSKTFNFNVTAPTTPGTYNFQWQMLTSSEGWFGQLSTNVSITVGVIPPAQSPSKEYIYVGGRLVATEESGSAGKRQQNGKVKK